MKFFGGEGWLFLEFLPSDVYQERMVNQQLLQWSEAFNYSISEHRPLTKSLQCPLSMDRRSS